MKQALGTIPTVDFGFMDEIEHPFSAIADSIAEILKNTEVDVLPPAVVTL